MDTPIPAHSSSSSITTGDIPQPHVHYEQEPERIPESTPMIERRKEKMNQMLWFKRWKGHLTSRPLSQRSKAIQELYVDPAINPQPRPPTDAAAHLGVGNVAWLVFFGWWLASLYALASGLLFLSVYGQPYARLCWRLKDYFFWPFGKYIVRMGAERRGENQELIIKKSEEELLYGQSSLSARICWYCLGVPFVFFGHALSGLLCWFLIVFIPMSKVNKCALSFLWRAPLSMKVADSYPGAGADVMLCTHQAINFNYYKYQVDGMNVVLVNLLPFVFFSLVVCYLPKVSSFEPSPVFVCIVCLISIIPLSYYLGQAISSLAAQTSMGLGALLNATFGSLIELILLFSAVNEGDLDELVQASVTGTLLGMLLLLPGLSMIAAGIKHPEKDSFNRASAGVSSVLLIVSVVGAFTPTVFYRLNGAGAFRCQQCLPFRNTTSLTCSQCTNIKITDFDFDDAYTNKARPLMYACAAVLPIGYIVGLFFTLKTHSHIFRQAEEETGGFDETSEAPLWSKKKSVFILLGSTALFGLIAEEFVKVLDPTLESIHIGKQFAGVTVFAILPSVVDYVNAVQFALQGNVSLSIEIGISAACQLALIQLPFLVAFAAIINRGSSNGAFTLIFPLFHVVAVMFAVIAVNYLSIECRSNYFIGTILLIIYTIIIIAFWFS